VSGLGTFTCAACGGVFDIEPGWNPGPEAEKWLTPEEISDGVVVCDDCWMAMRAGLPEMDERLRRVGL